MVNKKYVSAEKEGVFEFIWCEFIFFILFLFIQKGLVLITLLLLMGCMMYWDAWAVDILLIVQCVSFLLFTYIVAYCQGSFA